MRHDCLEKLLIQGKVEGEQRRGRSPKGWMDDIEERTGLTAVGATKLTVDRKMWSALLVATPALLRMCANVNREGDCTLIAQKLTEQS